MSLEILKKEIKSSTLRNLYLFYGEEDYLKKHYCESIDNIILKEDVTGLNKIAFKGKVETDKIIEACETMPVFLDRKLVVVKNSGLFKAKGVESEKEDFLEYIQNFPEYTCIVFIENNIDKRLKTVKLISKKGLVVEFAYESQNNLVKWAVNILKSHGKLIDTDTASFLIDISEPGMTEIRNEIDKLVLYLGERQKVTVEDITKVCTKSIKSRIFDLTDAVVQRDVSGALNLLNEMVALKEPVPKILFMITRQLRHVLEMKLLMGEGYDAKEACSKMGIHPYAGRKLLKQVGGFTLENLKSVVKDALDLDLAIKTGKINDRVGTEILICKLAEKC